MMAEDNITNAGADAGLDEAMLDPSAGGANEAGDEENLGTPTEETIPTGKQAIYRSSEEIDLETVFDVPVEVKVTLGQTKMSISELLSLGTGTVIELEKKVGEPVDVYVNKRLVARGEVVIVEDHIGITMTEIIKVDKNKD